MKRLKGKGVGVGDKLSKYTADVWDMLTRGPQIGGTKASKKILRQLFAASAADIATRGTPKKGGILDRAGLDKKQKSKKQKKMKKEKGK